MRYWNAFFRGIASVFGEFVGKGEYKPLDLPGFEEDRKNLLQDWKNMRL